MVRIGADNLKAFLKKSGIEEMKDRDTEFGVCHSGYYDCFYISNEGEEFSAYSVYAAQAGEIKGIFSGRIYNRRVSARFLTDSASYGFRYMKENGIDFDGYNMDCDNGYLRLVTVEDIDLRYTDEEEMLGVLAAVMEPFVDEFRGDFIVWPSGKGPVPGKNPPGAQYLRGFLSIVPDGLSGDVLVF